MGTSASHNIVLKAHKAGPVQCILVVVPHLNSVVKPNLNYLLVHPSVLEIKTFESPVLLLNPLENF